MNQHDDQADPWTEADPRTNRLRDADPSNLFDQVDALAAFIAGTGPEPPTKPTPRGWTAEAWASRMRIARAMAWRLRDRNLNSPTDSLDSLPGLTADERKYAEDIAEVILNLRQGEPAAPGEG